MSKKGLIFILVGLYLVCLAGCFFGARHYVREKDSRLYSEAINSLESYFRGRDRIVVIEYSGEKVNSEQVPLRKLSDDVKKKYGPATDESAQLSKKEYLWKEAYEDIYKRYEIVPRYQKDYQYTGFLFRVFENRHDYVAEYTLYPKYVGFRKQSSSWGYEWMPSVQEDINDAFAFFTTNEKSKFYGDFWKDRINKSDIASAVGNEYYELWGYQVHSDMVDFSIQDAAMAGEGDVFLGRSHHRGYYNLYDFNSMNELGYHTWFSNGYCRVYLEANPLDALTVRYRFTSIWGKHPMLRDMERICIWGLIILTLLFGVIIAFVALKK